MTKVVTIPKRRANDNYVKSSGELSKCNINIDVTTKQRLTDLALRWNVEISFLIRTCLEMLERGADERGLEIKGTQQISSKGHYNTPIEYYKFRNGDKWETGRYNEDLANDWHEYRYTISALLRKYKDRFSVMSQLYIRISTHEPNYTHLSKEQFKELFCKHLKCVCKSNFYYEMHKERPLSALSENQEKFLRTKL